MFKFNEIHNSKNEIKYVNEAIKSAKLQAMGYYDEKISDFMRRNFDIEYAYLVNSCTAALEISALLIDIEPGDEIIMPSYTYVTTASAFVRCGAKLIFVDVDESNMCIDLDAVESSITKKTKAIVTVHYAGVSCDIDQLLKLVEKYNLLLIEDAAQAIYSKYKDRYLGTIGHIGCFSFHETKNITSAGEGGMLIINDESLVEKAKMIIEKGTDRSAFLEKKVSSYTWKTIGSSYGMSQLNAAFLYAQLEDASYITNTRREHMTSYIEELLPLSIENKIEIFEVPEFSISNGHMFYIKTKDELERLKLVNYLKDNNIDALSHYEPLHSSDAGKKYGCFSGLDNVTTRDAKRLLRLPLHTNLNKEDIIYISGVIKEFYDEK